MANYYKVLGVRTNASPEKIKNKFKKAVDKYADSSLSEAGFQQLELLYAAYTSLIDPAKRSKHDAENSITNSGEEASWRQHYKDYKSKDLKADIAVADELFDSLRISKKQNMGWGGVAFISLFLALVVGGFAFLLLTGF